MSCVVRRSCHFVLRDWQGHLTIQKQHIAFLRTAAQPTFTHTTKTITAICKFLDRHDWDSTSSGTAYNFIRLALIQSLRKPQRVVALHTHLLNFISSKDMSAWKNVVHFICRLDPSNPLGVSRCLHVAHDGSFCLSWLLSLQCLHCVCPFSVCSADSTCPSCYMLVIERLFDLWCDHKPLICHACLLFATRSLSNLCLSVFETP